MDTVMLVITVLSVLTAAVSATLAWRVLRADRRRRAARVAALAAAAGVLKPEPAVAAAPAIAAVLAAAPTRGLLGASVSDSGSGGRQRTLMGGAAAFAGALLVVTGVWLVGGRASGGAPASVQVPLELVSLSHSRADGTFAVSGLVRNPAAGTPVHELEADVRVFDAAGIMIATKAARVDLTDLGPGQESPFVLPVGEALTAARYRVSFRSGGAMVPHVDKRVSAPAAVSQTADAR